MKRLFLPIFSLLPVFSLILLAGCSNAGQVSNANGVSQAAVPSPIVSPIASPVAPAAPPSPAPSPVNYGYKVLKVYPHDPQAFTQGLVVRDGLFYESTGLYGESSLRRVAIDTGKVEKKVPVSKVYFAEGLDEMGGKLYQLTWQSNIGFIYDKATFAKVGEFHYDGEGWGLTDDGTDLILSDGTNNLRFLDPKTFAVKRTISVFDGLTPLNDLNELEYVNGEIYANIWQTNSIARIDPKDGRLLGWVDMTGILPDSERTADTNVLNGIAYDTAKKRLFITGKKWPKIYEVELVKE